MRAISCRVKIELSKNDRRNLKQHRFNNSIIKKRMINTIYLLIRKGYRHFVIDIDDAVDYWLAELVYTISKADKSSNVRYLIGLRSEEDEAFYDWMDNEPLCNVVLSAAYRIYYRKEGWYERKYQLVTFSLSTGNKNI